jgi:hypothetical protein
MEGETTMTKFVNIGNKRQLKSILMVCVLVATSMMVIFPLTAPKAKAVVHLTSAFQEDGDPTYDHDGIFGKNGYVLWDEFDDHIISDVLGYTIEVGYTLNIPNLNYFSGNPAENVVQFQGFGTRIDVYGTLITNPGPAPPTPPEWTAFVGAGGMMGWDGIYFHSGSQGVFRDVLLQDSFNGIVMEPGSSLMSPGVQGCRFEGIKNYGMQMDGVTGYTHIGGLTGTNFYALGAPVGSGTGLVVKNGTLTIHSSVTFNSHGPGLQSLHIVNSDVKVDQVQFFGDDQPGYSVLVEGACDGTVFDGCGFQQGVAGNHYIQCNGSSILINNCTFDFKKGQLSVIANNNETGDSAHPILRNPNPPGITFDNTTIDVTGGSSLTLQWFMDVFVNDPTGNPIDNAPVWVEDRLKNPAEPYTKSTDANGWARWFITTELIKYAASVSNFNPFNVSALNNSMIGYANPKPMMNISKAITVTVPFSPIPNTPPIVTSIAIVPPGLQSGDITIEYMVEDPNSGDNGNMSVEVYWSTTGNGLDWRPATQAGGDSTTKLSNNVLYTFIWNSKAPTDLPNIYSTTVYIMILPYDRAGPGTSSQIGPFTVDNEPPVLVSGPFVTLIADTAIIEWTVHEPADANLWWGFTPDYPNQKSGTTGSTLQSVTLTGIKPGRNYTFVLESTDSVGNKFTSATYTFKTDIHIQLYKGWNMISIPPNIDPDLETALSPIAGQYDAVQVYEVSDPNDPWEHYRVGKPWGNDLKIVHGGRGFWIHMKNDVDFIPDHEDPNTNPLFTGDTPVQLEPGWNFVGYPSMTTRFITVALSGVPYDMVQTYDPITDKWLSYDPGSYSTDTLLQMEMGKGYWIHCTSSFLWHVDYE